MDPNIAAYIRQYRDVYTREGITRQLLTAGYPETDIEAAWREVDTETSPAAAFPSPPASVPGAYLSAASDEPGGPVRRPVVRTWAFWLTFIGTILLVYLVGGVVLFGTAALPSSDSGIYPLITLALYGVCGLVQLAALIAGIMLRDRNRPVALGLLLGLLFADVVLPVVLGLIVAGICIALIAGFNAVP